MAKLKEAEAMHRATIKVPGKPRLNWCDRAVQVIIFRGKIGKKVVTSIIYLIKISLRIGLP